MKRLIHLVAGLWDRIRWSSWYDGEFASSDSSIIIGGCARSGTTLIRVMLDTHPHIYCGPESNLFLPIRIRTRKRIEELSWKFDVPAEEIQTLMRSSRCLSEFIEKFFGRIGSIHGKRRWADKSPRNVLRLDYIFKHFPRAKFIHMIRDGRDVACSLRTFPKRKIVNGKIFPVKTNRPLDECIRWWVHDVNIGIGYRNDSRYYELKYEDLIFNTERALKELFMFLDEPYEEKVLRYYEIEDNKRRIIKFPQNIEATQPIYTKAVGRW
ncbi:MAG: sulfotransferase, partial [Candidatus Bathyarchaeota archaeon]|nr:sulfotransferase [Candidatus Bathyarchaeota archaeon]